ncbi:MAG: thioredoxin family protein [Myxococcota bacterium]
MQLSPLSAFDYYPVLDARKPPALVIFTGPACGACRRLKAILSQMAPPLNDLAVFEVDAANAAGLVEELEIFHLPALFLYADGDYHASVHPQLTAASIAAAVTAAAAGPPQPLP